MRDDAQQIHYFNNAVIAPTDRYEYDPLYRLLKAEGRELSSLNAPDSNDFANGIPVPNPSANAMQNYTQLFVYDQLGNIQTMSSQNQWTRTYNYNNTANNYLSSTQVGQDVFSYTYDVHGNMTSMPHLSSMQWDFSDRLRRVQLNLAGDTAYYIYDSTGNRCRKVVEKGSVREERYYVDGYEVFRKFISGDLDFERESLNILSIKIAQNEEGDNQEEKDKESQVKYEIDHNNKIVNLETKTIENGQPIQNPVAIIRYQYSNHLGSACLELDETASIVSYEEYHPFGTTSYRSGRTETEVSLKRYKYVGKERDEETGLYYYGARYYAAWLCRFVSVDPLQFKYPHYTPYQYAGNKPITYIDLDGLEESIETYTNQYIRPSSDSNGKRLKTVTGFTLDSSRKPSKDEKQMFGLVMNSLKIPTNGTLKVYNDNDNNIRTISYTYTKDNKSCTIASVGPIYKQEADLTPLVEFAKGLNQFALLHGAFKLLEGVNGTVGSKSNKTKTSNIVATSENAVLEESSVAAKKGEITVYRAFGGDSRVEGFSWTTANPTTVSNYRNVAGLPSGGASGFNNTADFMIEGKANVLDIIKTRSALPLDGNVGGLPEHLINPQNVRITNFKVLKP
ncbi:MAG: RHS repeat-associated core domain-containing protein [Bacteroidota bacterium]